MSPKNKNVDAWWRPALMMLGRFLGLIIFPVLVGVMVGMYLDKKYNTEPWLFLASVGAAFVVSMIGLARNTLKEFRKIEKQIKEYNKSDVSHLISRKDTD